MVYDIDGSSQEKDIFTKALLSYPPVIRVLKILKDGKPHTKFDIGSQLGFNGELGFTSIPQNFFVAELCTASSQTEKSNIRSNEEGDSDKYARTITRWLAQMSWVETGRTKIKVKYLGVDYEETLQSFTITPQGLKALKLSNGYSSNPQIPKIVYFEMLASKAPDAEYLRNKRARIIKSLSGRKPRKYEEIQTYLRKDGIDVTCDTIKDDIWGLERIGLSFDITSDTVCLTDSISKLVIPQESIVAPEISQLKDSIRSKLHHIDHRYLVLVDLAFSNSATTGERNSDARDFEIETSSLLTEELDFVGQRLGDASRPDVIISYGNYGTIIDNKAYKDGFSVDAHCADEMTRYILQNKKRVAGEPANEWWKKFPSEVTEFTYLFVTSYLKGRYADNLQSIYSITGVKGGAVGVENFLYLAENMKSGELVYSDFFDLMQNCELAV